MVYYSSSAASSIYSQDGVIFPAPYDSDLAPLIGRKDSTASKFSNFSQASTLAPTVYTEDYIKTLGYRPFEYWKGPLPKVYGPISENGNYRKKAAPLPPPRAAHHPRSRAFRNSLRVLVPGSQPQARLRQSWQKLLDEVPLPLPPSSPKPPRRRPRPPPSPRVKDRYKHRYKLPRKEVIGEWPGWEPDEAVVRYFATRFATVEDLEKGRAPSKGNGAAKKKTGSDKTTKMTPRATKKQKGKGGWFRFRSAAAAPHLRKDTGSDSGSIRLWGEHEHLFKPRTWTRRSWSIVATLSVVLLGLLIFLITTLSLGNDPLNRLDSPSPSREGVGIGVFGRGGGGGGAVEDALLRGVTATSRRAVHGGSLFRFGAIRHTP